jgi:hypothetical protein
MYPGFRWFSGLIGPIWTQVLDACLNAIALRGKMAILGGTVKKRLFAKRTCTNGITRQLIS